MIIPDLRITICWQRVNSTSAITCAHTHACVHARVHTHTHTHTHIINQHRMNSGECLI